MKGIDFTFLVQIEKFKLNPKKKPWLYSAKAFNI